MPENRVTERMRRQRKQVFGKNYLLKLTNYVRGRAQYITRRPAVRSTVQDLAPMFRRTWKGRTRFRGCPCCSAPKLNHARTCGRDLCNEILQRRTGGYAAIPTQETL